MRGCRRSHMIRMIYAFTMYTHVFVAHSQHEIFSFAEDFRNSGPVSTDENNGMNKR